MRSIGIKMIVAAFVLAGMSSAAFAALAPNYQRANELTAVISAASAALELRPITKVIYQKIDQYLVIADKCSIPAMIVSLPSKPGFVGSRQFDVKLGKLRCTK